MFSEVKTEEEADWDGYMNYEKEPSHLRSTSRHIIAPPSVIHQNFSLFSEVKTEPEEETDRDGYMQYEKEPSPLPSSSRQIIAPPPVIRQSRKRQEAARALEQYAPQTKARGYKIMKEETKDDPFYKYQRARNNDAVRKFRTKTKEKQLERENELNFYKDRCAMYENENATLKDKCGTYENEIKTLKRRLSKYEKI